MFYVSRHADGSIQSVSRQPQSGSEALEETHPDIQQFFKSTAAAEPGFEAVDAWADPAAADAAASHTGPMSMYTAAGFTPLRQVDGRWLMRRALAAV